MDSMAQTRTQIGEVIAGLNVGDSVQVTWEKSGNRSTETGVVWQPPSPATHLGLGPDLLNPADTELVGIAVTSRAPIQVAQPPIGAVAVFRGPSQNIEVFKRTKKGWLTTGQTTPVPWGLIVMAYKSPLQVFQPGTAPAAPVINTLTPGDRRITVAATLGSTGSSAITDVQYKLIFKFEDDLQQEATGWITSGQATGNFTILNVENDVEFSVRIRAVNSNGAGPESNLVTVKPFGAPSAPGTPTAVAGNAQAVLTWSAPSDDGGSAITGYKIEKILAANNDGWVTVTENTASTNTTYTVTGLTNGQLVGFRVTAINAAGLGTPSASTTGVTPSA